jgi:hypothetical protein
LSVIAGTLSLGLGIYFIMMGWESLYSDSVNVNPNETAQYNENAQYNGRIFSIISGVAVVSGIVALVLSMLTFCYRRSRGFICTTGVLGVVASLGFLGLVVILAIFLRSLDGDKFVFHGTDFRIILMISITGLHSLLWLVAGILTICFVTSGRHAKLENELDKEDIEEKDIEEKDIEEQNIEEQNIEEKDIEEQNIEEKDIEAAQAPLVHAVVKPESTTPVEDA